MLGKEQTTLYCIFKAIEIAVEEYKLLPFVYAKKTGENPGELSAESHSFLRDCMKAIYHHFCIETSILCCTKSTAINGNPYMNSYPPNIEQGLIFISPNLLLFSVV